MIDLVFGVANKDPYPPPDSEDSLYSRFVIRRRRARRCCLESLQVFTAV
jgi:hypothetical protein